MSESKFVVRKGHFHIADRNRFVLTGWFDGPDAAGDLEQEAFAAYLDHNRLEIQTLVFADESVRQKYAKFDQKVTKEYVIIVKLPQQLSRYHKLCLYLADGTRVYERRVSQLLKLQKQLECRITDIQITGASLVLTGWAASEKQVEIRVLDHTKTPVNCEVSYFPRPDVALEYRESEQLADCGFSIHVPVQGRKRMLLQITDGEASLQRTFGAVDKNRVMLYVKKAHYFMKRNGMKKTWIRAVNEAYELVGDTGNYKKWRKKNMPSVKELAKQRWEIQEWEACPLIYVVTPYRDSTQFLETAVSLQNQTYENWKWVVAAAAAEREHVKEQLRGHVSAGKIVLVSVEDGTDDLHRVMSAFQKIVNHIKRQEQANQAENEWVTLLGAADTLEPHAFYDCMKLTEVNPKMELCYTDEDQISEDGTTYFEPVFKSDFNVDMLRATNYFGHMTLVRGDLLCRLTPWEPVSGADAAYDYYLRAAEIAGAIGHLQQAVYHVRETNKQTPAAAKAVLDAHYKRAGIPAVVEESEAPGIYRTIYQWETTPMVSVLIPNMDHIDDLDKCVQSVLKYCTYPNYEIIIIENNSTQERTFTYYDKIRRQDAKVRVIIWKDSFNFSKIMNFGAEHANGEYLLLLNNDTEVIAPDFMEEMLGYCMREDVGICGARLFYFDDTIQHAGVVVGLGGICGEGFQGFPRENGGYQNRIYCPQDYSAVTAACLMTKKSVFQEVGGMDGEFQVAYNDIDYCLKVRKTGRLVVYNPFAMLYHYEYKSRGTENTAAKLARYNREVELFTSRWADLISTGDPYYNPNLTRRYQDFSLRRIELL